MEKRSHWQRILFHGDLGSPRALYVPVFLTNWPQIWGFSFDDLLEQLVELRRAPYYDYSFIIKDTTQKWPSEDTLTARSRRALNAEILRSFPMESDKA